MRIEIPHPNATIALPALVFVVGVNSSASLPALLAIPVLWVALVGVRVLRGPARVVDVGGLLALWRTLPRRAVDAVLPDPRARRGEVSTAGGIQGRIVGQLPTHPAPQVAVNDRAFEEMCAAFDQDNAALIETRTRWSQSLRAAPSPALVYLLEMVGWFTWFLPLLSAPLWLPENLRVPLPIALIGTVLVWAVACLILYGLLSSLVGLAAWLRAGVLSTRAERDQARAIRDDEARRSSASTLVAQMQRPPPETARH